MKRQQGKPSAPKKAPKSYSVPPTPEPTDARGLECPTCGCRHFHVIYTRQSSNGRVVRRRECRYCGRRISTSERMHG